MSELELKLKLTADGKGMTGTVRASREQVEQLNRAVRETADSGRAGARGLDLVDESAKSAGSSLDSMRGYAALAAGALATIGAGRLISSLIDVNTQAQKMQASLVTVTGSIEAANAAWDTLEDFASTTPFTLDQSVNGFIKMKSLGLDPTTDALTSFANTASAMGKDLNQMIEAVADASTSEFERLKEFGIKARQEGDRVSLIFQGVTTEIGNNSAEIVEYLQRIGETEFAGASARQMQTLGGAASNLQDNIDGLFRAIGEAGANSLASETILALSAGAESLSENLDTVGDVAKAVAVLVGARLASAAGLSAAAFVNGQIQAGRYQVALAAMQGVSARAAAGQLALASATRAASGAMALVGGPLGVALLAAGGLYAFREELGLVQPEAIGTAEAVDEVNRAFRELTATGRQNFISGLEQNLVGARSELERLRRELESLPDADASGNGVLPGGTQGLQRMQVQTQIRERIDSIELLEAKLKAARTAQNELLNQTPDIPGGNPLDQTGTGADDQQLRKIYEELTSLRLRNDLIEAGVSANEASRVVEESLLELRLESQGLTAEEAREYVNLARTIREAGQAQDELEQKQQRFRDGLTQLIDELDPLGSEFAATYEKQQMLIKAASEGLISEGQRDALIERLVQGMADGGEEGGDAFAGGFEDRMSAAADRVASSLQDAISTGNWDGVGASIGGALAGAIGGMVTEQLMQSLSGQAGAAIFGPIGGAIAGGIAGLAVNALSDFFSDDWDPTEARQAAQGTGTLLGDISAKSESIRRAVEGSESGIGQLVGINQSMLRALQNLQAGISGASTRIARGTSGIGFDGFNVDSSLADTLLGDSLGGITADALGLGAITSFLTGNLGGILTFGLGGLLNDALGGKSRQVDEGVQIVGGYMSDLIDETIVNAYATFRVKKNVFSSTKTRERYQRLGGDVEQQFALVFESIFESVASGADLLGLDVTSAINNFRVGTQRLSLENLSADEQMAELEAYFGTVFDNLSGAAIPWLEEFQQAGEGLGETLARVANQTAVTQEAINRLGIQFSDLAGRDLVEASERLMDAAGGIESFISSMNGFIDSFATDTQKFQLAQSDLTRSLSQLNMSLPATRAGYYDLLQAQNGATASGAENIATLLRLQDAADTYYTMLEDYQRDLLTNGLREAEAAAQAVTSAIDSLSVQTDAFSRNQRAAALDTLRAMAESGVVRPGSDLTSALDTATSINTGEFGTVEDYVREVARTGAVLADLDAITQEQVTVEQRMLDSLEQQNQLLVDGNAAQIAALNDLQSSVDRNTASAAPVSLSGIATSRVTGLDVTALVDEVRALRAELKASQGSIARHTQKSARVLERLEIDGIEVRE